MFEKCEENKQILIHQNNILIDTMIEMKKHIPNVTKEEIIECRDFWNERRIETPSERLNRETKEMLEEMKEEKRIAQEMTRKMIEKEKQINELIEKAKIVEMKNEMNGKMNEIENNLNIYRNEMMNNYVKKNELNKLSVDYKTNISKEARYE